MWSQSRDSPINNLCKSIDFGSCLYLPYIFKQETTSSFWVAVVDVKGQAYSPFKSDTAKKLGLFDQLLPFVLRRLTVTLFLRGVTRFRKVPELVREGPAREAGVQLIKRFSGGGTVIVDSNTIFAGLILNANDLPVECYPRPIMQWTADFYATVFGRYGKFSLQDQGKSFIDH